MLVTHELWVIPGTLSSFCHFLKDAATSQFRVEFVTRCPASGLQKQERSWGSLPGIFWGLRAEGRRPPSEDVVSGGVWPQPDPRRGLWGLTPQSSFTQRPAGWAVRPRHPPAGERGMYYFAVLCEELQI